jgi:glutamyl-tRNA synthetase
VRVRFAPSPTGLLHIGGARTALFNWLQARHDGGEFVLRIEDTDTERNTPENVAFIFEALEWLGLNWDGEAVSQVARTDRHQEVLAELVERGLVYRSTATGEDVKAWKAEHGAEKGYRGTDEGEGAYRLRVPEDGETVVRDLIRGDATFRHAHLDDPVIARADGRVLYNFAVAVDDHDMEITHVIRGDDHLSNTPKQLLVFEAMGWEPPIYAHIPLIHGPDGKKLSKRHGAVSVQEFRDRGYLPEALRNYLSLLGWGPEDDETMMSTDELIKRFDVARVQKNPARFDEQKLKWLNGKYIRELSDEELTERIEAFYGRSDLGPAVAISREKIATLEDFWPLAGFIYDGPAEPDEKTREKWLASDELLSAAREAIASVEPFDVPSLDAALRSLVEERGVKPKDVFQPIRVALAGTTVSPGIFETIAVLGREETLRRMDAALAAVPSA